MGSGHRNSALWIWRKKPAKKHREEGEEEEEEAEEEEEVEEQEGVSSTLQGQGLIHEEQQHCRNSEEKS